MFFLLHEISDYQLSEKSSSILKNVDFSSELNQEEIILQEMI